MFRCAILDDYQNCALGFADWASLQDTQVQVFTDYIASHDVLADRLAGFEIIVVMRERTRFDAALLQRLPKLKLLVTTGASNSAIDTSAAHAQGIVVCGTRNLTYPAPELAWGLLLSLIRHIPAEVASFRAGERWQTRMGSGLSGKTLGIIGLGSVGSQIARYALAFQMKVLAWSPGLTRERCDEAGVELASSLSELLQTSDVVTLHAVLNDATRGMLGAHELALLKPTCLLINTSRGPLIDETALISALQNGQIAGAALDVYDKEPLPIAHPFRTLPNVIATPHIGYVIEENYRQFYGDAVEDIQAWIKGSPLREIRAAGH